MFKKKISGGQGNQIYYTSLTADKMNGSHIDMHKWGGLWPMNVVSVLL